MRIARDTALAHKRMKMERIEREEGEEEEEEEEDREGGGERGGGIERETASDRGSFREGTFTSRWLLAYGKHEKRTRI